MCALRDFHSVKPTILAQQYRLNIPDGKKKPVIVERKPKGTDVPQIQIDVADVNSNVQFSPRSAFCSMTDDDFDISDEENEEERFFASCLTPVSKESSSKALILRVYEKACNMHKLLPLTRVKNGLLKQSLSCRFIQLQDTDCKCICYALCNDRFVERLDFQQNGMGPQSPRYFAEVIESSSFLNHIRIAENDLRSEGARVICEAVIENRKIVSLDLSGNGFVESDGEVFGRLIRESGSLKELYLAHNELMDYGVRHITDALKRNSSLTVLDLSWNHIRLKGALAIGEALEVNDSLVKVNLAWNGLHKEGAESLSSALQKNDTLIELDLTCNRLSEYCIAEILRGLDNNSTLTTLRIGQNHVTTKGALTILKHIHENKTSALSLLDLGNQEVHDKFEELYKEVQKERDLEVIYGVVWSTDRTSLIQSAADDDEVALLSCNPLTVLMECMRLQNMRLLDFFKLLDTNKSNLICINELCDGMLKFGIPVRRQTLLRLLHKLDVDNNAQLDYGEMVEAQNMHRQNLRRIFAANETIQFEKTEIGKVSVILRRIMGKTFIMKKTHNDSRARSARKARDISRSNTPSPFQLEERETGMSNVNLKKDYLNAPDNLSKSSKGGKPDSTSNSLLSVRNCHSRSSSLSSVRSSNSSRTSSASPSSRSRVSSASSN